jgi:hypothetical protein
MGLGRMALRRAAGFMGSSQSRKREPRKTLKDAKGKELGGTNAVYEIKPGSFPHVVAGLAQLWRYVLALNGTIKKGEAPPKYGPIPDNFPEFHPGKYISDGDRWHIPEPGLMGQGLEPWELRPFTLDTLPFAGKNVELKITSQWVLPPFPQIPAGSPESGTTARSNRSSPLNRSILGTNSIWT